DDFSSMPFVEPTSITAPTTTSPVFNDTFTQANGTSLSPSWTVRQGQFQVQNNQMAPQGAAVNRATVNTTTAADVKVEADITLPVLGPSWGGLVARYIGAGDTNMLFGAITGTADPMTNVASYTISILRNLNGVWTV